MIRLDEHGTVVRATEEAATRFETDVASLVGRQLVSVVAAADRSIVEDALSAVHRSTDSESCACRLAADEECWIEIELAASPEAGANVTGFVRERRDTGQGLATARDRFGHLFDLIQDAVVEIEIVDGRPIVRTVNAAFEDVFGYDSDTVLGASLNEFILSDDHDGRGADFDRRTASGKTNYAVVTRETTRGPREFLYRGIPYERPDGRRYGFAIYADITDQRRAREYLQVLNRVLRHNLRNEMTVVHGMAEQIAESTERPEQADAADRIMESARRLTAVSRKASMASDVVEGDAVAGDHTVDAATHVRQIAADYRDRRPNATIETEAPATATVTAGPALPRAIANVVENAIEHSARDPTVEILVAVDGDVTTVRVRDDGPGIPPTEWDTVFGSEDITQLNHGSGLGLWLVKWAVESAGGRVDYDRTDGWTSVTLTLPTAAVAAE